MKGKYQDLVATSECKSCASDKFQDAVAQKKPRTVEQFEKVLDDCWWDSYYGGEVLSQDYIRNLYHSMPSRLDAVLKSKGQMTEY